MNPPILARACFTSPGLVVAARIAVLIARAGDDAFRGAFALIQTATLIDAVDTTLAKRDQKSGLNATFLSRSAKALSLVTEKVYEAMSRLHLLRPFSHFTRLRISFQLAFTVLCLAGGIHAQVPTAMVAGTTATQAILAYSAPDGSPCTVDVSESPSFDPLVHDVDPALYLSGNTDTRDGNITNGRYRIFVAGRRLLQLARDGNTYSRALQANTIHYYRIRCAGATSQGSFTTANIPLGMTNSDAPQADPLRPGQLVLPTLPDTRGATIIDPQTGALLKRVSTLADGSNGNGPFLFFGGFVRVCSPNLVGPGPGYICSLPSDNGGNGLLYYIIPSSGESRFLGQVPGVPYPTLDPVDNKLYKTSANGNTTSVTRGTYTGTFAAADPKSIAPFAWETFLNGTVGDLIRAFDPAFITTAFNCGFGVSGQYAMVTCLRNWQDSYGWIAVLDMGNRLPMGACGSNPSQCPRVIAAIKLYDNPRSRWCGLHNVQLMPSGIVSITPHGMGGTDGVLGAGPYTSTLINGISTGQTSISVSGEPASSYIGDPYVPTAQTGDWFVFTDTSPWEYVQLKNKISSTSWELSRNAPKAHPAGAKLMAECNVGKGGYRMIYWKFLADPHGKDTTNTNYVIDDYWPIGGHDDWSENVRLTEDYLVVKGPIGSNLNVPITFNLDSSPQFAGASGIAFGQTTQKHPSYHQSAASPADQNWFLDYPAFSGGNLYSPSPGAALVSGQLYKYLFDSQLKNVGNRKARATLAISGVSPLIDISGPGSSIGDTSAYSYKYCVAYLANECRAGSQPGDAFANAPNLTNLRCANNGSVGDLCIGAFPTFAQGIAQLGLLPNKVGEYIGSTREGAGYSRMLSGGLTGLRMWSGYPTAKALPDASWALFSLWEPKNQVWMVKMPPFQQNDMLDRSGFLPLQVALSAPTDSRVTNAVVEFGYTENGAPSQHFCTSRLEACVAVAPVLNQSDPFKYVVSDQYTGTPCKSGCSIAVPVLPMHVVYYQAKYLDASGAVIALGPRGAAAELGGSNESVGGAAVEPLNVPAVTGLTTSSLTATQVALTWITGAGRTVGFKLYRDGGQIATSVNSQYTDTAMSSGASHSYYVIAYDAAGMLSAASATLNVNVPAPVAVQVSPQSATILPGASQQFTASVTGSVNTGVTWQVTPAVGTISSSGLYTSPTTVATQTTITITAVSLADPAKSGTASGNLSAGAPPKPVLSGLDSYSQSVTGGSAVTSVLFVSLPPSVAMVATATSTDPTLATPPATITINAGQSSALAMIQTSAVTVTKKVDISFSAGGVSKTVALTLNPVLVLTQLDAYAQTATGGSTVSSLLVLNASSATSVSVTATSSDPAVATVPATVAIPALKNMVVAKIQTSNVAVTKKVDITFSFGGASRTLTLTVTPPTLAQLDAYAQTATGGSIVSSLLVLSAAPPASVDVTATSSDPTLATVPPTVTIAALSKMVVAKIQTSAVAVTKKVDITFSFGGASRVLTLTLLPPSLAQLDAYAQTATGGTIVSSLIVLNAAPPASVDVTAISSDPTLATVPATVTIAALSKMVVAKIQTSAVTVTKKVDITFSFGGASRTLTLTLVPPVLAQLDAYAQTVKGGSVVSSLVVLNATPSTPVSVTAISSDPTLATVPATVTIGALTKMVVAKIQTSAVTVTKTVNITFTAGGVSRTLTLTLTP